MAAVKRAAGLTGYPGFTPLTEPNVIMLHLRTRARLGLGFRPMRWFRSSRRRLGWLALLALVLQLGLSFGHVHGTRGSHPAAAQTATADAGNASSTGDSSDADYCATCAILALLTGAQTASCPGFRSAGGAGLGRNHCRSRSALVSARRARPSTPAHRRCPERCTSSRPSPRLRAGDAVAISHVQEFVMTCRVVRALMLGSFGYVAAVRPGGERPRKL